MDRSTTTPTAVRVTHEDLPRFRQFMRKDAVQSCPDDPEAPDNFVKGLERALSAFDFLSSDAHWLLAGELNGEFVGYLTAVRVPMLWGRVARVYVDGMSVLKAHRRKGVASALFAELERIAGEVGASEILLNVNTSDEGARRFYRALGMRETPSILCRRGV